LSPKWASSYLLLPNPTLIARTILDAHGHRDGDNHHVGVVDFSMPALREGEDTLVQYEDGLGRFMVRGRSVRSIRPYPIGQLVRERRIRPL
jgi:hypothetical protein